MKKYALGIIVGFLAGCFVVPALDKIFHVTSEKVQFVNSDATPKEVLRINPDGQIESGDASLIFELDRIFNRQENFMRLRAGEVVTASWYGAPYHGRRMANREVYDQESNTLAHRTLPFGTAIVLRNEKTGAWSLGIVRDRGPFIEGRDIDLSRAIARELGIVEAGIAQVRMFIVWAPSQDVVIPRISER